MGKTWLMKEFGSKFYTQYVYINFDNNERMKNLFEGDLDVQRIIIGLELYAGYKIDPDNFLWGKLNFWTYTLCPIMSL